MTKTLRRQMVVLAGIAALALAVAACGGTSNAGSSYGGYGAPAGGSSGKGSVALASSKLGKILVDGQGRTLYLFEADKGTSSACSAHARARGPRSPPPGSRLPVPA